MAQRPSRQLNVSELDFNQIKNNLKDFLRSQDTLQDYDFEGSALSTLLDVMSYVTHYNAVNANIGINETFLETAQSRGSVVGHARQLGYTPKSAIGAVANVAVQVDNPNNNSLTLKKGHRFKSVIDGTTYTFVTTESYETTNAFFGDVQIKQGESKTTEYIFDVDTSEKFIIPDVNVDTTTLDVRVYDNALSNSYTAFKLAKDINNITSESPVYFLNETFEGLYEVMFGDGTLGQALANGNLIEINYLITQGPEGNGAARFTSADRIEGNNQITVVTNEVSNGGVPKESIRSIKYNAPLTFASQNRAVTADDYRAIILENFTNVKSIVVWGGEDSDPPQYGKVFIAINPLVGTLLSSAEKEHIVDNILKPKAILSITPEFIDPEYTYIALEVYYKYNPIETNFSQGELNALVRQAISNYNNQNLEKFDGIMRYSLLSREIDTADDSIINSVTRVYLKKRFVPVINQSRKYELSFSSPLYVSDLNNQVIYDCTTFTYNNIECIFQDYIDVFGERRIRIVEFENQTNVIVNNVGYVDAVNSKLVLDFFSPSAFFGEYIEVTAVPNSYDVAPKRNNLLSVDMNDLVVSGAEDKIVSGSAAGGTNYDLVPKNV